MCNAKRKDRKDASLLSFVHNLTCLFKKERMSRLWMKLLSGGGVEGPRIREDEKKGGREGG